MLSTSTSTSTSTSQKPEAIVQKPEAKGGLKVPYIGAMKEIGSWFRRRESTPWSEKEIKALKALCNGSEYPPEFDIVKARYAAPGGDDQYRRKDIQTLLNNWNGEIDRAKEWKQHGGSRSKPVGGDLVNTWKSSNPDETMRKAF
jgi:hypothetical protein